MQAKAEMDMTLYAEAFILGFKWSGRKFPRSRNISGMI